MCLTGISKEEEAAIIKKLPNSFPCWKILKSKGGMTWYHQDKEPLLTRGKVHKAKYHIMHRTPSKYETGFHAYISHKDAAITFNYKNPETGRCYYHVANGHIVKFWAMKKDIVKIGKDCIYPNKIAVVIRNIERK